MRLGPVLHSFSGTDHYSGPAIATAAQKEPLLLSLCKECNSLQIISPPVRLAPDAAAVRCGVH